MYPHYTGFQRARTVGSVLSLRNRPLTSRASYSRVFDEMDQAKTAGKVVLEISK